MQPSEPNKELFSNILQALESGDGNAISNTLSELHPADIGPLIAGLTPEQRPTVWERIPDDKLGETLLEMPDQVRASLLAVLDKDAIVAAVRGLDVDDIADLIPELPDEVLADILLTVDRGARAGLGEVLSYPEDSAGGTMNIDALTIREHLPLRVISRYLRLRGELPEHTDKLFVVDRENRLKGVVPIAVLLTQPDSDYVGAHMDREPVAFNVMATHTDVATAFEKYNLVSAAVVDDNNKLLGRITIDDAVDVLREAADHSLMVRAGLSEEEDIFAPVRRSVRRRVLWLAVNLLTAVLASWVIAHFEHTIEKFVALAVLMPIVASMGGNAGTQTLTIVIRGLGMGTISPANARRVLWQEILVGGLNGLIFALAVAIIAVLWYGHYTLGLVIALAMIINLAVAAAAGVLLPMALQRLGIDPALAGGVALTTVTDVVGFLALLGLAALLLI